VQVLVYAGAIMVLFLFVVMYLNLRTDLEVGAQSAVRRGIGWIVGAILVAEGALFVSRRWAVGPQAAAEALPPGNTQAVGQVLYSRYLFPFEITSMVLLVAMVGAIMISKPRRVDGDERGARRREPERATLSDVTASAPEAIPVPPGTTVETSEETEVTA